MILTMRGAGRALSMAAALLPLCSPALGQSAPATAGIAAGLGLTAASGATSVTAGAGTIEAALLSTDGIDRAGSVIASLVNAKASK